MGIKEPIWQVRVKQKKNLSVRIKKNLLGILVYLAAGLVEGGGVAEHQLQVLLHLPYNIELSDNPDFPI